MIVRVHGLKPIGRNAPPPERRGLARLLERAGGVTGAELPASRQAPRAVAPPLPTPTRLYQAASIDPPRPFHK